MLPTEKPWPRFVIPTFGTITLEFFYLYSGMQDQIALYLYEDEDFLDVRDEHDDAASR